MRTTPTSPTQTTLNMRSQVDLPEMGVHRQPHRQRHRILRSKEHSRQTE